jgi:hypothetical protein
VAAVLEVRHSLLAVLGEPDVDRGDLLVDAHGHAAQSRDHVLEAHEVDDRASVEGDAEVLLDRLLERAEAVLALVEPGKPFAAPGERRVDPVVAARNGLDPVVERRDVHVAVARDRDEVCPVVRRWDVQQDDRVGPDQVGRGLVGPLVNADEQDVLRPADRHVLRRATRVEQVGLVEVAGRRGDEHLVADDDGAAGEHQERADDHEYARPPRVLGATGGALPPAPGRLLRALTVRRRLVTLSVEHRAGRVLQCWLLIDWGG